MKISSGKTFRNIIMVITISIFLFSSSMFSSALYEIDPSDQATLNNIAFDAIFIDEDSDFGPTGYNFNGSGTAGDPYRIEYLTIDTVEDNGIFISDVTVYFIIQYCSIDAYYTGIFIQNIPNGRATIYKNSCSHIRGGNGITLSNVENCTVEQNTFINNYSGLFLASSTNCNILNNTFEFNSNSMIYSYCEWTTIENNTVIYSAETAMEMSTSNYTSFVNNSIVNSDGYGINLYNNNYGNYTNNTLNNNYIGIQGSSITEHVFSSNFIYFNAYYGVRIYYGTGNPSENNLLYHNTFINNLNDVPYWYSGVVAQAYDSTVSSTWYSDDINEGNYWSDFNDTMSSYVLDGSGQIDLYPLDSVDSDGDNIDDLQEEFVFNTDKYSNDTDSDNINDYDEIYVYHTNARSSDTDFDGLIDGDEVFIYGTSPLNTDTDADGLNDYNEVIVYLTNPLDTDSDDDSMPDGWEAANGLDPSDDDANGDLDSDGLENVAEYLHHSDPQLNDTDSDGLFDGAEVNTYSTDPIDSDTDDDDLFDGEEVLTYLTDPTVFDTDDDNLGDGYEVLTLNTDPLDTDTDDDSMPDGWEVSYHLDPTVNDADADPDEDGLSNLDEYERGTNPNDPDSDGDTYSDGEEVRKGRDPLDPESHPLAPDVRNQIIGGSIFGGVLIIGITLYILVKKRIINFKR